MGGGVSFMENVEELLTTTILIGKAISAVQFPGMYRLYDFHSKKAPKLKNAQVFRPFFQADSDDEDHQEEEIVPDPADYSHFFHVRIGEDVIYIEDLLSVNDAGWLPLHACCMSLQTVEAGIAIIDEMIRLGSHLDHKTLMGPGTFNKCWTPLQMACAYGVEPLVDKLVEAGADVNACNSFGYSCMLEACHRGYIIVAKTLLKGEVDLAYIPSEEQAANSPFASAPCQSALAEAARSGFFKVVQTLLDAGAPKDLANRIGWTALHEACFYNRVETVKTLLLGGCDATLRTRLGALPYHLACIPEIKSMLESMGGPGAVPSPGHTVDMLQILTELTMPADFNMANFTLLAGSSNDEGDELQRPGAGPLQVGGSGGLQTGSRVLAAVTFEPAQAKAGDDDQSEAKRAEHKTAVGPTRDAVIRTTGGTATEQPEGGGAQPALLHSGPLLGNLPAFGKSQVSPKKFQSDVDQALRDKPAPFRTGATNGLFGNVDAAAASRGPSLKADDKSAGKKKKQRPQDDLPKDTPPQFVCQLTRRLMSDPVKTVYGNVYDKTAIVNWISTQGKICPLTGAPLAEADLIPCEDLGKEIKKWILLRSTSAAAEDAAQGPASRVDTAAATSGTAASNDDLYDF